MESSGPLMGHLIDFLPKFEDIVFEVLELGEGEDNILHVRNFYKSETNV